jgi:predicted RNA-binding Zn-ribbon protein involved in translation (DUF1610 family)
LDRIGIDSSSQLPQDVFSEVDPMHLSNSTSHLYRDHSDSNTSPATSQQTSFPVTPDPNHDEGKMSSCTWNRALADAVPLTGFSRNPSSDSTFADALENMTFHDDSMLVPCPTEVYPYTPVSTSFLSDTRSAADKIPKRKAKFPCPYCGESRTTRLGHKCQSLHCFPARDSI